MSVALSLLAATTQPDRRLVRRGGLDPALAALRAQVASRAGFIGPGGDWAEALADVPRFTGPARRLLIEGQRTNAIPNPRGEGAVPGSPGTPPTGWSLASSASGVALTGIAAGVENGIGYLDLTFAGTATSAGSLQITPMPSTSVAAATGQTWTASLFARLAGGTLPGAATIIPIERNAGGTGIAFGSAAVSLAGASLGASRIVATRTLSGGGTVAFLSFRLDVAVASGATVNATIRIAWPQLEQAAFASTPILPPAGAPAASTRGADLMAATLSSLGIAAAGRCTLLWSGVIGQAGPAGTNAAILHLDDGSGTNAFLLQQSGGSGGLTVERRLAGATASASLGSMSVGTLFRAGVAISGGRIAGCLNGGAVQAVSGGPVSGLATLRIGAAPGGANALFGEVAALRLLPFALADGALPGAVSALPA